MILEETKMNNQKFNITPKIQLSGEDGTSLEIDVSKLDATPEQKIIVKKLRLFRNFRGRIFI